MLMLGNGFGVVLVGHFLCLVTVLTENLKKDVDISVRLEILAGYFFYVRNGRVHKSSLELHKFISFVFVWYLGFVADMYFQIPEKTKTKKL